MNEEILDAIEAEDLDLNGYGEYFDDGEGEYFDDGEGEYFDDGEGEYFDDSEGEYFDDDGEVYAEEYYFGEEPDLAERRSRHNRRLAMRRRAIMMKRAAQRRALAAQRRAAQRRRQYASRLKPPGPMPRRPSYRPPPSPRPVTTARASKAFKRVDANIQRTRAAVRNVDLDNKVQSDITARALAAQRKRIDRNEYAQAASKVVDELRERFPELKDNEVIKTALPLAPLLFLKPHRKGAGFESALRDPRVVAAVVAAGAALFSETRDKDKTAQEVTITPGTFTLPTVPTSGPAPTVPLIATARDRNGRVLTVQPSITFTSSDTAIATVDPNTGVVTGVASGTVLITATVTGTNVRNVATVTVS